jgi:Meckel syndrome type 1 protein
VAAGVPAGASAKPKPFTPSPVAPNTQASPTTPEPDGASVPSPSGQPTASPAAAAPAASGVAAGERFAFTFQVGEYAHAEKAKELMGALEGRGFSARMEQGKRNNRNYFRIFATKEGNRAELEGELLACGVTEPRLAEERPVGPSPAASSSGGAAKASPSAAKAAPTTGAPPLAPRPGKYAPPVLEPAPPLPDGYVPPPKKSGS